MDKKERAAMAAMTVNPNPRLVWFMDFALDAVTAKLLDRAEYAQWLDWAVTWKQGHRAPARCVEVARECFAHENDPVWHTLGQLAWGAKEACYSLPNSGWLVIRYIADAMVAFGIAFPEKALFGEIEPPTNAALSAPAGEAEGRNAVGGSVHEHATAKPGRP